MFTVAATILPVLSAIKGDLDTSGSSLDEEIPLDDLSSDSDDEYFDVVPLPGLRPPPPPPAAATTARPTVQAKQTTPPSIPPTHSRSLPAINKGIPPSAMGNNPGHVAGQTEGAATPTTTTQQPATSFTPKHTPSQASLAPIPEVTNNATSSGAAERQLPPLANSNTAGRISICSVKKYQAPQPPKDLAPKQEGKTSEQETKKYPAPQPPKDKENKTSEQENKNEKRERRISEHEGKKYQAPQPPKDLAPKQENKTSEQESKTEKQEGKQVKQDYKNTKPDKLEDKQYKPEKQEDNQNKPDDKQEGRKETKQDGEVERPSLSRANSTAGVTRKGSSATSPEGGSGVEPNTHLSAFKEAQKIRRVPSFKKYPAPQPPSTPQTKLKSESVSQDVATRGGEEGEDITATSPHSGSVPTLEPREIQAGQGTTSSGPSMVEKKDGDGGISPQCSQPKEEMKEKAPGGGKQSSQAVAGESASLATSRKARAGSPVPNKVSVVSSKKSTSPSPSTPTPAVLTGKLEITTGEGSATVKQDSAMGDKVSIKVAGVDKVLKKNKKKEDSIESINSLKETESKGNKESSGEEASLKDIKKIPNGILPHTFSQEKPQGKKTQEPLAGKTSSIPDDNTTKDTVKTSAAKETNKTDNKKSEKPIINGTLGEEVEKIVNDENSKYKKMNGTHHKEDATPTPEDRRSRSSSVASDVTSPDISLKSSGAKRRAGKLAAMMNKFEAEESQPSTNKGKPKVKVGKISGLASVFEGGGGPLSPKSEVKSPYSAPFSPERKAPEPKNVNIAGISTSKFGSVAKFKKPPDPKKKDEEKPGSEKKTKTKKSSTVTEKKEGESRAGEDDQKDKNSIKTKNQTEQEAKKDGKLPDVVSKKNECTTALEEHATLTNGDLYSEESSLSTSENEVIKVAKKEKPSVKDEKKEKPSIKDDKKEEPSIREEQKGEKNDDKKKEKLLIPNEKKDETKQESAIKDDGKIETKEKPVIKENKEKPTIIKDEKEEKPPSGKDERKDEKKYEALDPSVTPAAAEQEGAATQGIITSKGSAKPGVAKTKDTEAKITDGESGFSKVTKDTGAEETVSKGDMHGRAGDVPSSPQSPKGTESLLTASHSESAKCQAASDDKSHSKPTKVETAERDERPVEAVGCQAPSSDVTNGEVNQSAATLKTKGILATEVEEHKTQNVSTAKPAAPEVNIGTDDVLPASIKVKGTTAKEVTDSPSHTEAPKDTLKDSLETRATHNAAVPGNKNESSAAATTEHKSGEVISQTIKTDNLSVARTLEDTSTHGIVSHKIQGSAATAIEHKSDAEQVNGGVIPKTIKTDYLSATKTSEFESAHDTTVRQRIGVATIERKPDSEDDISKSIRTDYLSATKTFGDAAAHDTILSHKIKGASVATVESKSDAEQVNGGVIPKTIKTNYLSATRTSRDASTTHDSAIRHKKVEGVTTIQLKFDDEKVHGESVRAKSRSSDYQFSVTKTPSDDISTLLQRQPSQEPESRGIVGSSSLPQLSEAGASGYSWKTQRIRRKIDDAIAHTSSMLPRLESEVEALVRVADDYLGDERRARRSWTPVIGSSCPQPPASPPKSQGDEEEEVFEDAIDTSQLDTLMPLPDVQMEREKRSRSRSCTPLEGPERSPSSNSLVAHAESLLSETDRLLRRSRSDKSLRRSYTRSLSSAALHKLAEVTADLSEEHSTAHLAGERLEAEQAERMKLEKEVERLQNNMRMMSTANGKLEMEKQALRSEVLNGEAGGGQDEDEDEAGADASLYRRKYEWCLREIELLKKQLKQQQEDDLDHLLLLKKQLEKKVADAYEETEEQRQVVAQVKRKSQRIQAEMNDLKILLEEQTSRNNLLEKKQRKFDQDMMAAQEEVRHERGNKEKIQREKDQILSEKYSFEQEVATLKLELELKEEKLTALNRELEDLNFTGKTEEEVAVLKKAKHDLELRVKDQEEELDDLAGQVQMLEGAKVRLEMSIEQMRKENRREVSQREEELEEVRLSAQKKVKALESQLENEHEERTLLVREKHELERRMADLQERTVAHVDEEYVHKLKKELKKTKALLRDTQTMLEKSQSEGGHKLLVRQLKTQLEDAEFAKTAAIKARQCAEADLAELTSQLEEAQRARKEAEDKCARVAKDRAEIQTQLEESEEEVAEVMKKYKSVVSQLSVDQITLSEQTQQIAELEHEKQVLHERLLELSSKVEVLEGETANIHTQRRLEMKIKEVESKLELEQTTRQRLESQIGRLKDQLERVSSDCDSARHKESQAVEQNKRINRQLREAKEDLSALQQRHTEAVNKKSEVEKQLEVADAEVLTLKSDLKLAFKRIEDLQQAIQGDLNDSDSDLSDSDSDSDGSLSSYLTASLKQQRSSSNSTLRTPPSEVHQLDRLEQPTSPCSEAISEDLEEAMGRESFA